MTDMRPADITFHGQREKYEEITRYLQGNNLLSSMDLQFLLALIGFKNNDKRPLQSSGSTKDDFTISRTGYSKNQMEFDTRIGLLSILEHQNEDYHKVINQIAFEKNGAETRYTDLSNVNTFYSYFNGGISHLYDAMADYDIDNEMEVFDSLYEYLEDEMDKLSTEE